MTHRRLRPLFLSVQFAPTDLPLFFVLDIRMILNILMAGNGKEV
jgi:hypothetical protein